MYVLSVVCVCVECGVCMAAYLNVGDYVNAGVHVCRCLCGWV